MNANERRKWGAVGTTALAASLGVAALGHLSGGGKSPDLPVPVASEPHKVFPVGTAIAGRELSTPDQIAAAVFPDAAANHPEQFAQAVDLIEDQELNGVLLAGQPIALPENAKIGTKRP